MNELDAWINDHTDPSVDQKINTDPSGNHRVDPDTPQIPNVSVDQKTDPDTPQIPKLDQGTNTPQIKGQIKSRSKVLAKTRGTALSPREQVTIAELSSQGISNAATARALGRSRQTVTRYLAQAREVLEANAPDYAAIHKDAAVNAAKRGAAEPAQWALERLGVVKPPQTQANKGITVKIGVMLPGLAEPAMLALEAGENEEALSGEVVSET